MERKSRDTIIQTFKTEPKNTGDPTDNRKFCQLRPKPEKIGAKSGPNTYTPLPQQERIKKMYCNGASIRAIARGEGKARETITKIVRSADLEIQKEAYEHLFQQQMVKLLDKVIPALERGLESKDGAKLGFELLDRLELISPKQRLCPRCRRKW
jgi:hypothetical protein